MVAGGGEKPVRQKDESLIETHCTNNGGSIGAEKKI